VSDLHCKVVFQRYTDIVSFRFVAIELDLLISKSRVHKSNMCRSRVHA